MVPSKPDDFKNMLKITHVRGTEQGTQKNKKALFFARVYLRTQSNPSLDSASVSLRTKSNLLETLVTNRLPKIFFVFFQKVNPMPLRALRCFSVIF